MPTVVPPRAIKSLFAIGAAPAIWVERARGRKRLVLIAAYAVVAAGIGLAAYRWAKLREIPDVAEPFSADVPPSWRVPDDQNALVFYRRAAALLRPMPMVANDPNGQKSAQRALAAWTEDWADVPQELRGWLDANRETLAVWRQGVERPRAIDPALLGPRGVPRFDWTPFTNWFGFPPLARLAAARCEARGDRAEAWAWYVTLLRTTRQLQSADPLVMTFSEVITVRQQVFPAVVRWAADKRTDARLLRRAIADVDALDDLPENEEPALRALYRETRLALDQPWPALLESAHDDLLVSRGETDWYSHAPGVGPLHWFLKHEPERSRRVQRLIFANWLEYVRTPRRQRGEWVARTENVPKSRRGAMTSLTVVGRRVDSEQPVGRSPLVGWYASTVLLKKNLPDVFSFINADAAIRANQRRLIELLIREIEWRERKSDPDEISDELVARYLREVRARPAGR